MTDEAGVQAAAHRRCDSCQAEAGAADRFCRACGAALRAAPEQRATQKKKRRRHAAVMLLSGMAIGLFAVIHRDPADLILVMAFGLPLCGAGAVTWRMG